MPSAILGLILTAAMTYSFWWYAALPMNQIPFVVDGVVHAPVWPWIIRAVSVPFGAVCVWFFLMIFGIPFSWSFWASGDMNEDTWANKEMQKACQRDAGRGIPKYNAPNKA